MGIPKIYSGSQGSTRLPHTGDPVLVFDVRQRLPNPYSDRTLRPLNGKDTEVQQWVYVRGGREVLAEAAAMVRAATGIVNVFFLCVGGRHRSAALAEMLADEFEVTATHRSL